MLLILDSATKRFELTLEVNRIFRGSQSWQTERKTASDKYVKDSGHEDSAGQDSWHGYLHMSTYGCQAYAEIYSAAKGTLELLGTMHTFLPALLLRLGMDLLPGPSQTPSPFAAS